MSTTRDRADLQVLAEPPTLTDLAELVRLVAATPGLHVPRGRLRPARGGGVHDDVSGCVLPGVPALRLTPEPWWPGAVVDWVARQVAHRPEPAGGPEPHAVPQPAPRPAPAAGPGGGTAVVRGSVAGRGWDGEPLLAGVEVVALLSPEVVAGARRHHARASSGCWPAPQGDVDWIVLA
ncbi:DUF6098 family protein [Aquipuribacter sp. SD81]|uniref:DUF6098 family protein n=1 Tax=Aquipuribacter sp. SD81 TaxID=3127703 RepID=UPI00301B20C0